MDFEKHLKKAVKDLEKEEKFLLKEYEYINSIKNLLIKADQPKGRFIHDIKAKTRRKLLGILKKVSRAEYRRHRRYDLFSKRLAAIKENIVPEKLKQLSEYVYDTDIYDGYLVKYISRGGVIESILKGENVDKFTGEVSHAQQVVSTIIENTISPHVALNRDIRNVLKSKDLKVAYCHLDIRGALKKIRFPFSAKPEIVFDTSFLKDFDNYKQSEDAGGYSIDFREYNIILLKSVLQEARGIRVSGALINHILSLPNTDTVRISPTPQEQEFIKRIWQQYSRKGSRSSKMDFADLRILAYAYRRAIQGTPVVILAKDEDIESVAEFLARYNDPRLPVSTMRMNEVNVYVA